MTTLDQAATNRQILQEFLELFMTDRWDEFDRIIHPECVMHYSGGVDEVGLELAKEAWRTFYGSISDLQCITDLIASEGDLLMVFYTIKGTFEGTFEGKAVGPAPIRYRQAETMRIEDGRVVEWWVVYDEVVLAQQVGFELVKG
jgi:predicted ester cyclase